MGDQISNMRYGNEGRSGLKERRQDSKQMTMIDTDSKDLEYYNQQRAAWRKRRRAMKRKEINDDFNSAQDYQRDVDNKN